MQPERPARSAPAPARRGYRKGDQTRDRLVSTAQEVIYEVGFNRATSREIARRAGVTFGVIQHHFGTFEALLLAAGERGMTGLAEALSSLEIAGKTTEEKLTSIADLLWRYFSKPEYVSLIEIVTNLTRDPATSAETQARLRAGTVATEKLWLDLVHRTFDQEQWHSQVLRRLLFATMTGIALTRWTDPEQPDFAQERRFFVAAAAAYLDTAEATDPTIS